MFSYKLTKDSAMIEGNTNMVDKSKIFDRVNSSNLPLDFSESNLYFDPEDLEYCVTTNKKDIRQYITLVNEIYKEEINLENSYEKLSRVDLNSHFLVAKDKEKVLAGVRFSLYEPITNNSMPSETKEMKYKDLFKEYNLEELGYSELTKYVASKSSRNYKEHYKHCFSICKDILTENGIKYMVICSEKARLRFYNFLIRDTFQLIDSKPYDLRSITKDLDYDCNANLYELK